MQQYEPLLGEDKTIEVSRFQAIFPQREGLGNLRKMWVNHEL